MHKSKKKKKRKKSHYFCEFLARFEWSLAKQIEDDNALVSREPLFPFMQNQLFCGRWCWNMNCFAIAPSRTGALKHSTRLGLRDI